MKIENRALRAVATVAVFVAAVAVLFCPFLALALAQVHPLMLPYWWWIKLGTAALADGFWLALLVESMAVSAIVGAWGLFLGGRALVRHIWCRLGGEESWL